MRNYTFPNVLYLEEIPYSTDVLNFPRVGHIYGITTSETDNVREIDFYVNESKDRIISLFEDDSIVYNETD